MKKRPLFEALLDACRERGVRFVRMDELAEEVLARRDEVPVEELKLGTVDGRSGLVAVQAPAVEPKAV
jgi:hypothetical protein